MITGPDISSHQHESGQPLDFAAVKAAGHTFVVVKATEGSSYVNPFFRRDVLAARAAGLVTWPYIWVSPGDGAQQGRYAVQEINKVFPAGTLVWLDYEQEGVSHVVLHDVRATVEATGYRTGTYTFPDYWQRVGVQSCQECGSRPLWWADYNPAHNRPAPAPWTSCALRQTHGTSYTVPGIPGLNDMSRAEVDLAKIGRAHV